MLAAALVPGLCEVLVTTPWIEWHWAPAWMAQTLATVGFLAFLMLAGFTGMLGNAVVGAMLIAVLWRRWRWPFWQAALASAPYWIVFCRTVPKPW